MVSVSVELVAVSKSFTKRELFTGLTAKAGPGQCLAVTGKNGSGKSTLLKIIAGILRPTAGAVVLRADGRELRGEERMMYTGMVSPEIVMYDNLTGRENLRLISGMRGLGLSAAETEKHLNTVGLAGCGNNPVHTYSTGMKQRLKMALLLAVNPGLWLLDEPSSNLDADGKAVVSRLVQTALDQRATVILATNEAAEVGHATVAISLD